MKKLTGDEVRVDFETRTELEDWLKENSLALAVRHNELYADRLQDEPGTRLILAGPMSGEVARTAGGKQDGMAEGIFIRHPNVFVPVSVFDELRALLPDEGSNVRRLSSWPIVRAFVYLDISDFSKLAAGTQLFVIQRLINLSELAEHDLGDKAEAKLCIGDGYIYVWPEPVAATRFSGYLARQIEAAVAAEKSPDFHFRMGVHVGSVHCFWDPGRGGWNYVGDGINGGNRVLSAIGKETDDVVFVSGAVRSRILAASQGNRILPHLHNRGRKADKHGRAWRVYELNHSAPDAF